MSKLRMMIGSVCLVFLCSCFHLKGSDKNIFNTLLGYLHLSSSNTTELHVKNIETTTEMEPVIVLGGGVAGLTAALYLSQANIPCTLIEGPKPGGALAQSHSLS